MKTDVFQSYGHCWIFQILSSDLVVSKSDCASELSDRTSLPQTFGTIVFGVEGLDKMVLVYFSYPASLGMEILNQQEYQH